MIGFYTWHAVVQVNDIHIIPIVHSLLCPLSNCIIQDFTLKKSCFDSENKLFVVIFSTITFLTSLFINLPRTEVRLIGGQFSALHLSPVLTIAVTLGFFPYCWDFSSSKDFINNKLSGFFKVDFVSFISFGWMLSSPWDLEALIWSIAFEICSPVNISDSCGLL